MLKPNHALDTFCEATRIYDIGQWELNGQNQTPRDLSLLYEIYGPDKYIDVMTKKLKRNSKHFLLNKFERESIKLRKELIQQTVMSYIGNMDYKNICAHKAGIAYISYAFRNEVAQCLRKNNTKNIDVVILISLDNSSISIRNIKTDVNVRPIAEKLGGKGHFGAGGGGGLLPSGGIQRRGHGAGQEPAAGHCGPVPLRFPGFPIPGGDREGHRPRSLRAVHLLLERKGVKDDH